MKSKSQAKKDATKGQPGRKTGRSIEEFRNAFDKATIVPSRVKAALAALGTGWMTELEFAKLAGVSLPDLGTYREAFEGHVVVLPGEHKGKRLWAGTKAVATRMREMLR